MALKYSGSYDLTKITEWEQWKDYALGDVVKYKEFYYPQMNLFPLVILFLKITNGIG